jgi:hypothetical protein
MALSCLLLIQKQEFEAYLTLAAESGFLRLPHYAGGDAVVWKNPKDWHKILH